MKFYTSESLGLVQHMTPAGFLICKDVPIARSGKMLYTGGELPRVQAGRDGIIVVTRDEALFEPDAIASFEGSPITDSHPPDFIDPRTWRTHAIGHAQNVRRGSGEHADKLIADLVITDHAAIEEVRTKQRRHISLGYDADYEQQGPGQARQVRIIGNHVALVREGRCGPTCSIGDEAPMTTLIEKLRAAFASKDDGMFNSALAEVGGPAAATTPAAAGGVSVHVHATGDRAPGGVTPAAAAAQGAGGTTTSTATTADGEFQKKTTDALTAIADGLKGISDRLKVVEDKQAGAAAGGGGQGTTDALAAAEAARVAAAAGDKTLDAAAVKTAWTDAVSKAEIMLPGVSIPTNDASATPQQVHDATCAFRKRVLTAATLASPARQAIAAAIPKGADIATMTCDAITTAFDAAAEIARLANNRGGATRPAGGQASTDARGGRTGPYSPDEINAAHAKHWGLGDRNRAA